MLANIAVSEFGPADAPTVTEAEAARAGEWPAYARDDQGPAYARDDEGPASPPIPALLLHGGLDPSVRVTRTAALRAAWPVLQPGYPNAAARLAIPAADRLQWVPC